MRSDGESGSGSSRGKKAMQTAALLAGAAGLLLFIVGVKRRYRLDEEREIEAAPPPRARRRRAEPQPEHEDDAERQADEA
jgi:hypothetical protein